MCSPPSVRATVFLDVVASKWTVLVLYALTQQATRDTLCRTAAQAIRHYSKGTGIRASQAGVAPANWPNRPCHRSAERRVPFDAARRKPASSSRGSLPMGGGSFGSVALTSEPKVGTRAPAGECLTNDVEKTFDIPDPRWVTLLCLRHVTCFVLFRS
jgi:hypothetical protein